MQSGPLGAQLRYQYFDPINGELVSNAGADPLILLDSAVEFVALLAHRAYRDQAGASALSVIDDSRGTGDDGATIILISGSRHSNIATQ
jgi:hypothetical protein